MAISCTTASFNNFRAGWNYSETIQTAAKIRTSGIRLARQYQMAGDLRGTESKPLVAAGVTMRDGLMHDLMPVNTMGGDVYCFDYNTLRVMWLQHLCNPVPGTKALDMYGINDNWSFLSTAVIDPRMVGWHVGMASPDGSIGKSAYWVFGLSLIDGSIVAPPINLNTATYQVPFGALSKMGTVPRKQRCALLLDYDRKGVSTLFVANGSFNEDADTNQGWLVAIDVSTLAKPVLAHSFTTTPGTPALNGGGLWMGAQGPAMDNNGALFMVVGNGSFNAGNSSDGVAQDNKGNTAWGESGLKISYDVVEGFTVVGNATRFTDTGRVAGSKYQMLADTSQLPDNFQTDEPAGTSNMDSPGDQDENSGGAVVLDKAVTGFSRDYVFQCGKDGIGTMWDADNPPNQDLSDFAPDLIQTNVYGRMKFITGFTNSFGYPNGMNLTPDDLSQIATTYGGYTHHHHSTPLHYQSPKYGTLLYGGGENGMIRCFQVLEPSPGVIEMNYMATGTMQASPGLPPPGGMPGWMLSGWSANNQPGTGAIAAVMPYGDANKTITNGRLVILAADSFEPGGTLEVLWDSEQWGVAFIFNKFNYAACINGVITYFTYDAKVLQFL